MRQIISLKSTDYI